MSIKYPVRLERDPERIEVHIRDASNRVIASGLIGIDAAEIVERMNAMTTGKVEYAPDYEPKKRRAAIYAGGAYADYAEVFQSENEHQHLEAEVVKAAREWCGRGGIETQALWEAVIALEVFEKEQEKK